MIDYPHTTFTIHKTAAIAKQTFYLAFTRNNIWLGFASTKICSLNSDIFTDTDYASSHDTDRPLADTMQHDIPTAPELRSEKIFSDRPLAAFLN